MMWTDGNHTFVFQPIPPPQTAIINYDSDNELSEEEDESKEEDSDWEEEENTRPKTL
jgi:hypothetical protein